MKNRLWTLFVFLIFTLAQGAVFPSEARADLKSRQDTLDAKAQFEENEKNIAADKAKAKEKKKKADEAAKKAGAKKDKKKSSGGTVQDSTIRATQMEKTKISTTKFDFGISKKKKGKKKK